MKRYGAPVSERFLAYTPDRPENGCWEWRGPRTGAGYGQFSIARRSVSAHRWSYEHHNGVIAPGMEVRHVCDNPPCVNPAHLVLGTHKQNMQDMVSRHRQSRGEKAPHSVLTESVVIEMRAQAARGEFLSVIAARFGQSLATTTSAVQGKSWSYLPGAVAPRPRVTRTECRRGHPLLGANVRFDKKGARVCVTCGRENGVRYAAKRRLAQSLRGAGL